MNSSDIAFPNIGLYLENVPKTFSIFGFQIAFYGMTCPRTSPGIQISPSCRKLSFFTLQYTYNVAAHILDGTNYIQVHPTFLYEGLWNLALMGVMLLYRQNKKTAVKP